MTVAIAKRQEIIERRARVAALRLGGMRDQSRIAAHLGVSPPTIHRDCRILDAQWRAHAVADVATEKGLDLDRLECLIAAVWPEAMRGNLPAVDRLTRLLERKAKLLGLDAPERMAVAQQGLTTVVQIVAPADDL